MLHKRADLRYDNYCFRTKMFVREECVRSHVSDCFRKLLRLDSENTFIIPTIFVRSCRFPDMGISNTRLPDIHKIRLILINFK